MAPRWGAHRLGVTTMACLIMLSPLAATSCGGTTSTPCTADPNTGQRDICIADVTYTSVNARTIALQVRLARGPGLVEKAKVWWVVSPLGSGAPWDRAIFTSRVDERVYAANTTVLLTWDTNVALPSALYDLAVLVHLANPDGSETHVDDRVIGPIRIGAPATEPWLVRAQEGSGPAVIASASEPLSSTNGPNLFSRNVQVANQGYAAVDFSVHMEARALLVGWEDTWWAGPTLFSTSPVLSSLQAGGSKTVRLDTTAPASLLTSFPTAQLWVVVTVGGVTADEALLGGPDTFRLQRAASLSRHELPTGPIELTGIAAPGPWVHATAGAVALTLSNLTGSSQVLQAWWYLAATSDQHPWTDASTGGQTAQVTLGPWATTTIAMRSYKLATAGRWELSAWVHYEQSSGTFAQTDALWLTQQVAVT